MTDSEFDLARWAGVFGYTREWFELGFIDPGFVRAQAASFEAGEDRNVEHYKWAAYRFVLASTDFSNKERWHEFVRLIEADPDEQLFRGALAELLDTDRVPPEWLLEYEDKPVHFITVRVVRRKLERALERRREKDAPSASVEAPKPAQRGALLDVAMGLLGSFVSRNNDLDGYWALGRLRSLADRLGLTVLRFDLKTARAEPADALAASVARNYREALEQKLARRRLAPSDVVRAEITVEFQVAASPLDDAPTYGKPVRCTVLLVDRRNRAYERSATTACAPHDPDRESRRAHPSPPTSALHHRMTSPFENIAECHPALRDAAAAAVEFWEPEPVPLAVGLGALANALVRTERDVPDDALQRIAAHVEEALAERGDVRDAVAAGFLEALAHRADTAPASVERVVRGLGPRAVEYLRAWDEFSGAETPGTTRGTE